jgi:N-acyl-L-homoserine lactone synthetase
LWRRRDRSSIDRSSRRCHDHWRGGDVIKARGPTRSGSSRSFPIIRYLRDFVGLHLDRMRMRTPALIWDTAHQHGEAWVPHHRLGYTMFVVRQEWAIPVCGTIGYGEFEAPAATYLLAVVFIHVIAANGCLATRLASTRRWRPHVLAAACIDVSSTTLKAVRRRTGIHNAVLEPKLALVA